MKKIASIFFILFTLIQISHGQTVDKKLALGFSITKNLYVGDYGGNGFLDLGHSELLGGYSSYGFTLGFYVSPSIEFGFNGNYGDYGYMNTTDYMNSLGNQWIGVDRPNSFLTLKFQITSSLKYKFHFINDNDRLIPFLSAGLGIAGYARNTGKDKPINPDTGQPTSPRGDFTGSDIILPFGFGVRYRLTDRIALQYQYNYNQISFHS